MVTNKELLELVTSQDGDSYVFGVEVRPSESDPEAFDCSELIEWACSRLECRTDHGIRPSTAVLKTR